MNYSFNLLSASWLTCIGTLLPVVATFCTCKTLNTVCTLCTRKYTLKILFPLFFV